MKILQLSFMASLILYPIGQQALAEPSGSISTLMNNPISYFEYGMDQLGRQAEDTAKEVYSTDSTGELVRGRYVGRAEFDWDSSQITISLSRFALDQEPQLFEGECANAIAAVRRDGGIDFSTNKVSQSQPYSNFARLFMPKSHSVVSLPSEDIGKTLDASLNIRVTIKNPANKKRLICSAPFIGTSYEVQK